MIAERIISSIVINFVLTIALEAITGLVLGARSRRSQLIILAANCITNPTINVILTLLEFYVAPSAFYYAIGPVELAVVLTEGLIFKNTLKLKLNPFLFSLILNASSYFIGSLILKIF